MIGDHTILYNAQQKNQNSVEEDNLIESKNSQKYKHKYFAPVRGIFFCTSCLWRNSARYLCDNLQSHHDFKRLGCF